MLSRVLQRIIGQYCGHMIHLRSRTGAQATPACPFVSNGPLSRSWMAASAACNTQVSGRAMLQQVVMANSTFDSSQQSSCDNHRCCGATDQASCAATSSHCHTLQSCLEQQHTPYGLPCSLQPAELQFAAHTRSRCQPSSTAGFCSEDRGQSWVAAAAAPAATTAINLAALSASCPTVHGWSLPGTAAGTQQPTWQIPQQYCSSQQHQHLIVQQRAAAAVAAPLLPYSAVLGRSRHRIIPAAHSNTSIEQLPAATPATAAPRHSYRWTASAASTGQGAGPDWQTKNVSMMTPEEKQQVLLDKLADEWGEDPGSLGPGTHRLICPQCGNGSHGDNAFSVTVENDAILWCCHRATCGYKGCVSVLGGREASSSQAAAAAGRVAEAVWRDPNAWGGVLNGQSHTVSAALLQQQQLQQAPLDLEAKLEPLSIALLDWFAQRGISQKTLQRNGVMMQKRYSTALQKQVEQIAFPYRRNGVVVNIKYRALDKHFSQTQGGEQLFYGYDDAKGAQELVIVEGEMDKLALEEALLRTQAAGGPPAAVGCSSVGRWAHTAIISVPSGAPSTSGNLERKFRFLHNCSDILDAAQKIVLAVDADGPGVVLADELARRVGRERCWNVTWPTGSNNSLAPGAAAAPAAAIASPGVPVNGADSVHNPGGLSLAAADSAVSAVVQASNGTAAYVNGRGQAVSNGTAVYANGINPAAGSTATDMTASVQAAAVAGWARKDANEVLIKDGPELLLAYVEAAQPLPIRGLFSFEEFWPQVYDLYQQGPRGLSWGISTGWDSVDTCYTVVPGELTIVTGLSNSGKSEWIDALAVNLAMKHNWQIAFCSLENEPKEHGKKLIEKCIGKAFLNAAYSIGTSKLNAVELIDGMTFIDGHFHIIRAPLDELPSIDYILEKARAAVMRYGLKGLVIDPYNELNHHRPASLTETEHVSQLLAKVKRFAQHFDCHVWFVAHPRTQRGLGTGGDTAALPAPSMYDISGSAHFINKADNGIVVHRPYPTAGQEGQDPHAVQILVRKVRNKLAGKIGDVMLRYNRATGRYTDYETFAGG